MAGLKKDSVTWSTGTTRGQIGRAAYQLHNTMQLFASSFTLRVSWNYYLFLERAPCFGKWKAWPQKHGKHSRCSDEKYCFAKKECRFFFFFFASAYRSVSAVLVFPERCGPMFVSHTCPAKLLSPQVLQAWEILQRGGQAHERCASFSSFAIHESILKLSLPLIDFS